MQQYNFNCEQKKIEQLKEIAKNKRMKTGENVTIASLIRKAIDLFIKQNKIKGE